MSTVNNKRLVLIAEKNLISWVLVGHWSGLFVCSGWSFMLPNKLVKTVDAAVVTTLKPQHVIFLVRTDKILIIQSGTWIKGRRHSLAPKYNQQSCFEYKNLFQNCSQALFILLKFCWRRPFQALYLIVLWKCLTNVSQKQIILQFFMFF